MKKWSFPRLAVQQKRGYYAALFGVVVVGIVLSTTWAFGAFHPLPKTHAGGQGQQLAVTTTAASIEIVGENNYGQNVTSPCLSNPVSKGSGVIRSDGWWWQGSVTINEWASDRNCEGAIISSPTANIPGWYPSDWYPVSA